MEKMNPKITEKSNQFKYQNMEKIKNKILLKDRIKIKYKI